MGKLKITIRRKGSNEDLTECFIKHFPPRSKKIKIDNHFGVLTASNAKLFIGLQFLLSSLCYSYQVNILLIDTGMTEAQLEWCKRQPGVVVKKFTDHPVPGEHIGYVGAWLKPFYLNISPFKHTIWLDADMMVQGDLRELLELSSARPFFTTDYSNLKESTTNYPELYDLLPLDNKSLDMKPYLNTGLYVLNKKRDAKIIASWQYCVERAFAKEDIASKISCWDQGACKWALHKNDSLWLITPDKKFNYPAKVRHYSYPPALRIVPFWIESLKEKCVVMHWMGGPKPWDNWGEMLNLDLSTKFK